MSLLDAMPEAEYHAHPALSCSLSKLLLPPSCPAKFRHAQLNGGEHKAVYDMGHAAHALVLGVGAEIAVIDADSWRTNAAKEQQKAAYAESKTPLLTAEWETVKAMAAALRAHPIAAALFDPDRGMAEQSLFWADKTTDLALRARLDWLPNATKSGRMIVGDYKTTVSSEPASFAKSCATYGYAQQAAWYSEGVKACDLAGDVAFVFVAQEKTAPYIVTVFELDTEALDLGANLNRLAREVYLDCLATDTWPGYSTDVARISLPGWFTYQHRLLETA